MSTPVLRALRGEAPPTGLPTAPALAKVDILVVDDDSRNGIALAAMLESLGQNVVLAESGTQALRRLLERDFALVLLDVQMPGLDGFQTAEIIRGRERSQHLPIIFLTAYSKDDAQISQAYELGAVDFLFKPIVPFILRAKVQAFVELYRTTLENERQALRLRDIEHREDERCLVDAAQRREAERLRAEAIDRAGLVAELSLRNHELATADRRKDEFLAMLSHELHNPMAPIVDAIHLLRMAGTPAAVAQRALDALARQSNHMVRLIDDLLDLSRIKTGRIELRREPVTLASIVSQAIETSAPHMERGHHRFGTVLPDREITLFADGTRLGQVLANLLDNAAKFSPPRSKIDLEAEREGDEVVIRVRDEGMGLEPDLIADVFGLFVQSDRTAERAKGGLGIGLNLVKHLVELHGGSVRAYSAGLGKGTEFTVRLPIDAAVVVVTPPTREPPSVGPTSRARRIVIVEDNDDVGDMLKDLVECWGHRATIANDGARGVEAVLSLRPDIAFIDIGLPGLDGYQVASVLRSRAPALATRLVALTGYGGPGDRERALAAGFHEHVVKPIVPGELFELIESS